MAAETPMLPRSKEEEANNNSSDVRHRKNCCRKFCAPSSATTMQSALELGYMRQAVAVEQRLRRAPKFKRWHHEFRTRDFWVANIAEVLGTALMVFVGTAASLKNLIPGWTPNPLTMSLTMGISVTAMIQAFGHVSGAHIDPAVTLGFHIMGAVSHVRSVAYMLSQCVGAILGSAMLYGLTPRSSQGALGATLMSDKVTPMQGVFLEIFLTYFLVIMVLGSTDPNKPPSGLVSLAIGLTVTACLTVGIPLEGPSINPARSLGPAVVSGYFPSYFWIYFAGPMVGGALAGVSYRFLFSPYRTGVTYDDVLRELQTEREAEEDKNNGNTCI